VSFDDSQGLKITCDWSEEKAMRSALIFLHVPKSAGTTFNRIMDWEYNPLRVYSINGRYFRWSYRRLCQLSPKRLARIQVFKGHMPFGLHRLLPQQSTYLTILRDPVDRAISSYYFTINDRFHPDRHIVRKLSIAQFVQTYQPSNEQTKMIAGTNPAYDFLAGECTPETLRIAIENLQHRFTFVGLSERFEESLALAKVLFGWQIRRYASFRITRGRPPKSTIAPETRELIEQHNRFDVVLYQEGTRIFEGLLAAHRARMQDELTAIREAKARGSESLYYRAASAALKLFALGRSTLEF
jgi:Galactose-3-O-sulfotransferase